jgi:hypothetical protein
MASEVLQRKESASAKGLRLLIGQLTTFKVKHFGASSQDPSRLDREAVHVSEAHVVSSLIRKGLPSEGRHVVVLDIDHHAWLVKSSTPGHFHLYIDVPGGIKWEKYNALMHVMRDCGILEPGYVSASQERGHSDVRLPWIKKESTT